MAKINQLYSQIDDLNKKIEDEPLNFKKRKIRLENKINALDENIRHAGLKSDFSSVSQYKSQKAILLQKRAIDQTLEFKSQIEEIYKEIINIIIDYYQEQKFIEEIIQIENIPQSISDEWFNLSNFGRNTGYLFIDELEDNEFRWVYSNPINHVKFYSERLNELKEKINTENETLFIFDNVLAKQAEKRDLIIYQESINVYLRDLDNSDINHAQDIFNSLKSYEDNFSEAQIMYLCEIMCDHPNLSKYADDFNLIMDLNKDKINQQIYYETYNTITDNILNADYDDIFSDLRQYADKFNRDHLNKLLDRFSNKEYISEYFDDFNYIVSVNEDKINSKYVDECYQNIIDKHIEELNNSYQFYNYHIFSDLTKLANNFRKDQIIKLYNLVIDKNLILNFYDDFDYILKSNESKFDNKNFDKMYSTIIDNGLSKIEDPNLNSSDLSDNFICLEYYSNKFSKNQLNKLSSFMIENVIKGFVANKFHNIFERNIDKFDLNCNQIYLQIIDNRINLLKNLEANNTLDEYIMDDLGEFYNYFTKEQLNELIKIILENTNICNIAEDFINILEKNEDKLDEIELNELYCDIIDSRINILNDDSFNANSDIFRDLGIFSKWFNENQIITLANIIGEKNLVSYLNEKILHLFENNIDKFDDSTEEKFIGIIIDYKLDELEHLYFGFPKAKRILGFMMQYVHNFTKSQITWLCNISINNSQVYKCFICTDYLKFLLENNKDKIDKELYEQTLITNNIIVD